VKVKEISEFKGGHLNTTTPIFGAFYHFLAVSATINLCAKFGMLMFTYFEDIHYSVHHKQVHFVEDFEVH